ncbi:MAG TPA: hypothetical protein VMG98_10675 [Verrucomicrobiae bacterium]|nr:hypothetical protein [Verrucomicrobiae bacterium]
MRHAVVHARWWIAYPVALILLIVLDLAVRSWTPLPLRLPEQYSPTYLRLVLSDIPRDRSTTVLLGDSVLWGYKLRADQTAAAILQTSDQSTRIVDLAYEGGSTVNDDVMLRALRRVGVRPATVIANVNIKEFNPGDSAYSTLHPSLERLSEHALTPGDSNVLDLHFRNSDLNRILNDDVESIWRFYALRSDLREQLFGSDDAAGALLALVHGVTGERETEAALHVPTPDRFLGTYDLTPIGADNVAFTYYRSFVDRLCRNRIPSLLFLTPTNHQLLHEYIDDPNYDANLARLEHIPHCSGVRILNWDRAIPPRYFLDNDHLNPEGQRRLAQLISRALHDK